MLSQETPPPEPVVWTLGPVLVRADIPALCERLTTLLDAVDGVVVFDVSAVCRPDAVTVDALARLQLTARRRGRRIVITGANPRLLLLVSLIGVDGLLPLD